MSISTQSIHTLATFTPGTQQSEGIAHFGEARVADMPHGIPNRFGSRRTLFREGASASEAFMIVAGIVKLIRHLPNGRARIVGLHGPGAVLGMFCDRPGRAVNPHSAMTLGPVVTECWHRRQLLRLRRERPESYIRLLERVHDQVRQADLWITEFSTGRIRSRVARLILFLEEMEAGLSENEVELLTCQEMGEILGITQESVSRAVASMKREQLLVNAATGNGDRLRLDRPALVEIAGD